MAIFDGIFKEKKQQKKRSHTSDRGEGFLSSEIKKVLMHFGISANKKEVGIPNV